MAAHKQQACPPPHTAVHSMLFARRTDHNSHIKLTPGVSEAFKLSGDGTFTTDSFALTASTAGIRVRPVSPTHCVHILMTWFSWLLCSHSLQTYS